MFTRYIVEEENRKNDEKSKDQCETRTQDLSMFWNLFIHVQKAFVRILNYPCKQITAASAWQRFGLLLSSAMLTNYWSIYKNKGKSNGFSPAVIRDACGISASRGERASLGIRTKWPDESVDCCVFTRVRRCSLRETVKVFVFFIFRTNRGHTHRYVRYVWYRYPVCPSDS